jgi:hypothetical protein
MSVWVLTQSKSCIVDCHLFSAESFCGVYEVCANPQTRLLFGRFFGGIDHVVLGQYKSYERCKEVLADMLAFINSMSLTNFVYEMPAE